ncbi:MAG: DUF58 domain-containing protein [Planctomycetota bacterium]|nr:DUF58 domain-containing protein [Planctomycetota bacterium]
MATPNSSLELTTRGKIALWLSALAGSAAWISDDENARVAAAMLATPLVVDFVAKQRRLHFTSIRVAPRTTIAGALYTEAVVVEHRGRRPLRFCRLHEPRFMRGEPPRLLPTLEPFSGRRIELPQRSLARSHVLERVYVLESEWPLGMFTSKSVVSSEAELITEPARVPLRADVLEAATDTDAASVERSALDGPDFYALREHNDQEDARGVHALRSATTGTLVRRVTKGRTPRMVGVVLDLRRPPGTPRGRGLRHFEWSLGACASLVEALQQRGAQARVLLVDTEPETIDVCGPAQRVELMTTLSEASLSTYSALTTDQLSDLDALSHCYWISAGGFLNAPELRERADRVTLLRGEHA